MTDDIELEREEERERAARIRELNDEFRANLASPLANMAGRKLAITRGVAERGLEFTTRALTIVREFGDFTEDNDPWGERDFGSFEVDGAKLFWKIDYYDEDFENGSPDPTDPEVTSRALTILLAEEY